MTDGIIQKVFSKWLKYSNTQQCKQDISDIQQELIEEIKSFSEPLDSSETVFFVKWLIGDTQ